MNKRAQRVCSYFVVFYFVFVLVSFVVKTKLIFP